MEPQILKALARGLIVGEGYSTPMRLVSATEQNKDGITNFVFDVAEGRVSIGLTAEGIIVNFNLIAEYIEEESDIKEGEL